ncbi:MAG TPA: hypothetical protein VFE98_04050 [Candidatus Bathyarchaeia archaeon]|nr:hypothetical protein [Candidatus Bathyarchaeia archaeon]
MPTPTLVASGIAAVVILALTLGYVIGKRSGLVGIAFAISGLFSGLVLTVNYYVEVPWPIFVTSFTATVVSGLIGAFEVSRKVGSQDSS